MARRDLKILSSKAAVSEARRREGCLQWNMKGTYSLTAYGFSWYCQNQPTGVIHRLFVETCDINAEGEMLKILSSLPPYPPSSSFAIASSPHGGNLLCSPPVRLPLKYQDSRRGTSQLTCPCPFSIWQAKQPWGLSSLFSNWPFIISFLKEREKRCQEESSQLCCCGR